MSTAPELESLIAVMLDPDTAKTTLSDTNALAFAANRSASTLTTVTEGESVKRHHTRGESTAVKGQQALRAALYHKGFARRHWEEPIAPFLKEMQFQTRYDPYSYSAPVKRYVINPEPLKLAVNGTEQEEEVQQQVTVAAMAVQDMSTPLVVLPEDGMITPPSTTTAGDTLGSLGSGWSSRASDTVKDGNTSLTDSIDLHSLDVEELSSEDPHRDIGHQEEVLSLPPPPPAPTMGHVHHQITTNLEAKNATLPTDSSADSRLAVYNCLWYYRVPTVFPRPIMYGRRCAWALAHCVRRKLGGVCCDAHPLTIANMIYEACDVVPAGVDMFTNFKGRCSVWFWTEEEAKKVEQAMHQRVWMAPIEHGYALWTDTEAAQEMLSLVRKTMTGNPKRSDGNGAGNRHFAFPTHLLTVDVWEVR